MKTAFCRRHFLTRSALVLGASLLLPARALTDSPTAATPDSTASSRVRQLIDQYGSIRDWQSSPSTTRITIEVRHFEAMAAALAGAGALGITRIHATGTQAAFTLAGHHFELDHRHAA